MKITHIHRKKLIYYLNEFYKRNSTERFTIFHFVKYFKLRLKNNKDAWMGVSGETGSGKSYFVIMSQILFGRAYDLQKNITYIPRGNEIIEKFNALKFNTLLVDEAAKEMRSVNWHSKQQQSVNTKAMTDRFMNNWVFLNMPNFNEFTKSMKRSNIMFRAILPYRTNLYARVIIQRKSRNWRSEDPWGDKKANEVYDKIEKKKGELSNEKILDIERNLQGYVMDFIVPNLELILPEVTDKYQELKLQSRIIDDKIEEKKKPDRYRDLYTGVLNRVSKILYLNTLNLGNMKVTKKEIANALGISQDTLNKYIAMPENKPKSEKPPVR